MNATGRILAEISKLITYCFAASTAVLYMVIRSSYNMPVSWEGFLVLAALESAPSLALALLIFAVSLCGIVYEWRKIEKIAESR